MTSKFGKQLIATYLFFELLDLVTTAIMMPMDKFYESNEVVLQMTSRYGIIPGFTAVSIASTLTFIIIVFAVDWYERPLDLPEQVAKFRYLVPIVGTIANAVAPINNLIIYIW